MSTADRIIDYLREHNFTEERRGHWRGSCPWRLNSDSDGFMVTINGPDDVVWYDHVREEGGNQYDFCERAHLERPSKPNVTPVESTHREYRDLADYAEAHGVTASVFEAAKWALVTYQNRPALRFPTAGGQRWRFIDGKTPRFKSEMGYDACWYGLNKAAEIAAENNVPLVLVNGEASVVVCHHYGVPAAAVTGSGERAYPDNLLEQLRQKWSGRVIVALDCDTKGRAAAQKIAAQLSGYEVAVVDLQLGDKGDMADWCKLHRLDALNNLLLRADFSPRAETHRGRMTVADLIPTIQNRATMIRTGKARLYLPTGIAAWDTHLGGGMYTGMNVIAGSGGMGKTTLMASVASLWTAAGYRGLIVTTEMHPADWIPRIVGHMARVQSTDIMQGNVSAAAESVVRGAYDALCAAGHYVILETTPTVAAVGAHVLELVEANLIDFVMIDSMSNMRASGVSQSIYDQTKAVSNQLLELTRQVQTIAGAARPVPFVVSVQTNTNAVARRNVKVATALDAYGGQTIGQDATTYTTLNYPHYFVQKRLADPDPYFPEGVAGLLVDKGRFSAGGNGQMVRLRFVGGMGFYDDNVPPAQKADTKDSKVVHLPRQYKDDTHDDQMPFGDTPF